MSRLDSFGEYIEDAMKSWHCPGTAVAIIRGEDVLYQAAHGLRDVEDNAPMATDTRFAMASVTKSFAAMSIALLVDDGKLEWDKPVREYMPEFVLYDEYVTRNVTVRDMLSHRTGLPRHEFSAWRLNISRADYIKRMRHLKPSATFRERFQYNNLMYYAIAYLVEKVSGQRWEDFVHNRIFKPLGMTASNFLPEAPQSNQITSYGYRVDRDEEGGAKGLIRTPYGDHGELSPGSAGALFSTLDDLKQWVTAHVNEGKVGDVQLVSPTNLKQMHLPQIVVPGGGMDEALHGNAIYTYGMGWQIEPYHGKTLVHHGGNVEGFSVIIGFVPQEKIGVVVLTNIAGLPLNDALLYESVDRAIGFEDKDWNKKYHEMFDPIIAAQAAGKQTSVAEKISDAPPTHSLATYTGKFGADGYPDFAVEQVGDALMAALVGSGAKSSALLHQHYNVFMWHLEDLDYWLRISFHINEQGEVDSVSMPLEPTVDDIVFRRKPLEVPQDIIKTMLGVYDTEIDGLSFTITSQDGKIYSAQTGGTPEEINAKKLNNEMVALKSKDFRYEFVREDGVINRLVIKHTMMTLEATRRT